MPMTRARRSPAWGSVLLTFSVLLGCSGGARVEATQSPTPPARSPEALADLERQYQARIEAQRNRFVQADVEFMSGMIGHHAQALAMVSLVPERSASRSIQLLSGRIESSQRDEIRLMESWLRDREQPVPEWHLHGSHLLLPGRHDHGQMAGMLSDEQMAQLEASRGSEFDRLFLTLMIQHHEGAVEMVRTLFSTDGAVQDPEVFRFASDVQVDQRTEIARMERMLQELAGIGQLP